MLGGILEPRFGKLPALVLVADERAVLGHGANGVFGIMGMPDLPRDDDIERKRKRLRDLVPDNDPAARKRVNDRVRAAILRERFRKLAPRFRAIPETHTCYFLFFRTGFIIAFFTFPSRRGGTVK